MTPKADKSFIVRYSGGLTIRIDAPTKTEALKRAQKRSEMKVKTIIPMTPDWAAVLHGSR